MALKYDLEVELKSPADAVWSAMKDSMLLFPNVFPKNYKCAEILEGDGKSVGTIVRFITNDKGRTSNYKSKIDSIDEENKIICHRIIEGDTLKYYKTMLETITVKPKGEGSVAEWSCKYDKAFPYVPKVELTMADSVITTYQELDSYLLSKIEN